MPLEDDRPGRATQNSRHTLPFCISLTLILLGLMTALVSASGPEGAPGEEDGPPAGAGVIGVISSAVECLSIGDRAPCSTSGVVRLSWQGQVERARLVLNVAGTEAAHSIKVNGQAVALAPVCAGRGVCGDEEYHYLRIPPQVLRQGDNLIELTDDALGGDSWSATRVRLEAFGDIAPRGPTDTADAAIAATVYIFSFTNPYDGSSQEALYQLPDSYSGSTPTPLVIYAHGRSGTMEYGLDKLGDAANAKGWLLAAPQMHGSWIVPEECFHYPNTCDYDDQVLAGTTKPDGEPEPGAYAHASLESQYDIIGTAQYMVDHFNVKPDQIYLVGYSMGGQIATVTAAKFPHLFAAVFDNKGITNLEQWYWEWEEDTSTKRTLEKECHIGGERQTPLENPFCYGRRSSVNFGRNFVHIPISMTHSVVDVLVPISHSYNLRDAINSYGPDRPASVYEDTVVGPTCLPDCHCYEPNSLAVLNFLEPFTLDNNPTYIHVTSDESKSYYWMNLAQTGDDDHWSHVEVTRYQDSPTVVATIWDNYPATLAFNLGSTPIMGLVLEQPGMGLPATTYLVRGGGNDYLYDYASGYLIANVTSTGQSTLTISAITVTVSAEPAIVSARPTGTTTVTALVQDHLGNPVPEGTAVELATTEGTFPNGGSTYTLATADGQATTTLTLGPDDDLAEVVATVRGITASTSVQAIHPDIDLQVTPDQETIYSGQAVTYQYQIENTGDATLTAVTVADDNGTPGYSSDDVTVCGPFTLAAGATTGCNHSTTLLQTTTSTAMVTGQDPLGNETDDSASATVLVISPSIDVQVTPGQETVYNGQSVIYRYRIENTGDATLTDVTVVDNNGTPGNSSDDVTVCGPITLAAGATTACSRSAILTQTTTNKATVTGWDPLGNRVRDEDSATVTVLARTLYIPIVITGS